MTIEIAHKQWFHAHGRNDTSSGGGRIHKAAPVVPGVVGAVLPEPTPDQMAAGISYRRKIFESFQDPANAAAAEARYWLTQRTPGDDRLYFYPGTQRNTLGELTGTENRYGTGRLSTSASLGATQIEVEVEDGAVVLFRNTELLLIDDGTNRQFVSISGTPSIIGNIVTIDLADALQFAFAQNDPVASVYDAGTINGSADNKALTSASGTLDETQIEPQHVGAVEADITLTFTSATAFNATALIGSSSDPIDLGSGNITSDWSPNHPDLGEPLLIIPSAAWGGSWAASDSASFQLHPCASPLWLEWVVPAGANSIASNQTELRSRVHSSGA